MINRPSKSQPTWIDVKAKLAPFDRTELLGLVQDLYAAHKDNQVFLHARVGLSEDVLKPYRQTIDRWLWPDVFRNQDTSVAKAKQAISNYKKAVGEPGGLAELMVFYCDYIARQQPGCLPRQAGSSTQYQPQSRLWRRRQHGRYPCGIHVEHRSS